MTFISPRDLIKRGAGDHPGRIAITSSALTSSEEPITYGDLGGRTAMVAETLKQAGVGAGVQVALAISDPVMFFVCYFGVLEAGGIVAPISATATVVEAHELLTSSGARFLVVAGDSALPNDLGSAREPVTLPSGNSAIWRLESGGRPLDTIPWTDGGYFLRQFSSGSTGRPKHMLKTEANMFREGEFLRRAYDLENHEVFLVIAPLHHSAGQESFHLAFHCGATLLAMPQFIPGALIDAARRDRPTVMIGTPPVFDALASCLLLSEDRSVFRALRICLCGAGRLSRESHEQFLERFGIPVTVRFGSSETLGISFDSDEGFEEGRVGRPNPEVEIVVLDEDGNPCPAGAAGQIGIRSPAASSRYEGSPEASAQTFRNGWVFLGDVGYVDDTGNLHLMGRSDIISIGGHKVDKLEVERVIRDSLPVTDVVVMEATSAGLPAIRAVIEADPDQVTKAMVVAACRNSLSSYKIPRIVEIREKFERDANGKVIASSLES